MSHQFVTETIQEPIPLIIAGDSSVEFIRLLIEVISSKYPEFSPYILPLEKKVSANLPMTPYMICWVEGFENVVLSEGNQQQDSWNDEQFLDHKKKIE